MLSPGIKAHWQNVYSTKSPSEVSWTQEIPNPSFALIHSLGVPKYAPIIDIGGGESRLADFLLNDEYSDISVLDISEKAIENTKKRLGKKAENVKWIVSDITEFNPDTQYALWHDRATFHFLTAPEQIARYVTIASEYVTHFLTIGVFSENGPDRCSGLSVKRYSEEMLEDVFSKHFRKIRCIAHDHITPFNTTQNFIFCCFQRKTV